jgi:hypothetical protein
MRPTPTRVTPVALLTAVALLGAADPALGTSSRRGDTAAPVIGAITVNPSPVVLGTASRGVTRFAITVRANDPGGVDRVTVGLYDPSDVNGRAFRLKRTGGTATSGVWTGTAVVQNTAKRGAWSLRAFATDLASNTSNPDTIYSNFRVTLPTRFHKLYVAADQNTGKVTAQALLQAFRPGKRWQAFSKRAVALEFRPQGANSFLTVATAKTGSDGMVHFTNVAVTKSGTWRLNYLGNSGWAPTLSGTQAVTVKPKSDPGTTMPAPTPASSPTPTPAA